MTQLHCQNYVDFGQLMYQGSSEKQNKQDVCVCVCVCTYIYRQAKTNVPARRPTSQLKDQCQSSKAESMNSLSLSLLFCSGLQKSSCQRALGRAVYFIQATDSNVSSSRRIPTDPPRIMANPSMGTLLSQHIKLTSTADDCLYSLQ